MIHTNVIARVERYADGIVDLAPLFLDDDNQPYEKIVNARVISQRYRVNGVMNEYVPVYEKGDIVAVAIMERDFSDAVTGRLGNGGSSAKHELTSAVVIGVVMM